MNDNEKYLNIIELLKQALLFYADKENYLFYKDKDALIALDEGSQARFALKQIEELDEINEKIKSDYNDLINDVQEEESPENIMDLINKIKDIDED